MRLRSRILSLTGCFLLAGAFALHADTPAAKPVPWWATPIAKPVIPAPPAPGGTQQPGVVPPILDGTWWKLKVSAKGYAVQSLTGETSKASTSFTAYMLLQANDILLGSGPGDGDGPPFGSAVATYSY